MRDITVSVQEEEREDVGGGWPPLVPSVVTQFCYYRLIIS